MIPATDEMDNLKYIPLFQRDGRKGRTRDNQSVAFDRNLGGIEFKGADQIGDRAGRSAARFAIYGEIELCRHALQIAFNQRDASCGCGRVRQG